MTPCRPVGLPRTKVKPRLNSFTMTCSELRLTLYLHTHRHARMSVGSEDRWDCDR
jgi:hypothetical protein